MFARLVISGRVHSAVVRALAVGSLMLSTSALAPAFQGTVQFAAASSSVGEGGVSVQITVELSLVQTWDTSVPFTVDGTAALGVDFSTSPSPLVIPAGAVSGLITVDLVQDTLYEGDETVVLRLDVPTGAGLGATPEHILTLVDDDLAPAASFIAHRTVVDELSGGFSFRIELNAASGRDATVPFSIVGNASGPGDILAPASPAVVTAGQLFVDVPVGLVVDRFPELGEQVVFRLDQPMTHATPGAITTLVVLINDGNAGAIALPPALSATPSALSFPQVRIGETTATQQVVITNLHSSPLTFLGLAPESGQVESFSVSYPGGPVPVTLAPAQSVGVDVRFQPQATGPLTATFVVRQNFGGIPPSRVALSGIALGQPGADVVLNVGGPTFVGGERTRWAADYGATVSEGIVSSVQPVLGTTDDALYHDSRWGLQLVFALPVPNGAYDVRVRGWEPVATNVGGRVFDVLFEGALAFNDIDYVQLAGPRTAWVSPLHRVQVSDGVLDIDCVPSIGRALVSAIEVRAVPVVSSPTAMLNFGTVEQGALAQRDVEFVNSGLLAGRLTSVEILPGSSGPANEFIVEVGGQQLAGGAASASFPVDLTLPAGASTFVPVIFRPTQHRDNDLQLRFTLVGGDPVVVSVFGTGGANAGWGFLHPVIDHDPVIIIDYDNTGSELVELLGAESHTHEPGQMLTGFEWRVDGNLVATTADTSTVLPLGSSTLALTIRDSNVPQGQATDTKPVAVYAPNAVPGLLARYYDGSTPGFNEVFLVANVPAQANFVARQSGLATAQNGNFVGASQFVGDVMVRWTANFTVTANTTLVFIQQGGDARRVYVNGVQVGASIAVAAGTHSLDVRFAVSDVADLPLTLTVTAGGVPVPGFAAALTHSEGGVGPVIHTMPTQGTDLGGNDVVIQGFAFFPESQVTVNWGGTSIPYTQFADYSPERIHIVSPPGAGPIQVSVTTPNGTSNAVTFTYSPSGPVPVRWLLRHDRQITVNDPVRGAWGPDGRLWIATLDGSLRAVTYDDNWYATNVQYFAGVSQRTNKDVLGVTFNPYDVYDPNVPGSLKVYIAHGELFQAGGGTPTGPSPFTGEISVLVGPTFDAPVAILSGLPASNHDHSINGIEFDGNGDLLIASGGNTNAGVTWDLIGGIPESPLSCAILKAFTSRPAFNGQVQYRQRLTGLPVDDQRFGEDAVLAPGIDVEVFAPGVRNSFDVLVHTSGAIYATDNGPNVNYGPASLGQNQQGPHPAHPDELLHIERDNYYGHANRARSQDDARQSVYHDDVVPSVPHVFTQRIARLDSSTNGIEEYRATAFNSQLRGHLAVMKMFGPIRTFALTPDGLGVTEPFGTAQGNWGLDLAMAPGGAIFAIDYVGDQVRVQVPDDVAAIGLTPYDVFPARALTTGGVPFIIGGSGFGSLLNTSVAFNGVPAVLTAVSAKRIHGIVPSQPSGFVGRADVEVIVNANTVVIPLAFQYLPATPGLLPGVWRNGVPMPASMGEVSCAEVDGMIYVFGEADARTLRFDVGNGTWNDTLAQRPYLGNHHGCEVWNGKIFLIGGLYAASEGRVQIYDPVTNVWTLGAQMPWVGGSVVTALIDGRIYAGGGIVGNITVSNFAVYDPAADSWTSLGALPLGVNHAASATDGLRMFVFGGRQGPNAPQTGFTTVQVYDPAVGTWQTSTAGQVAAMPLPRGGTGRAIWYRGEFFVFGGEDAADVFPEVQAYSPTTNTWRSDANMPTARHGIFPVLYQDRVFVLGGGVVAGSSASAIVEVFQRP